MSIPLVAGRYALVELSLAGNDLFWVLRKRMCEKLIRFSVLKYKRRHSIRSNPWSIYTADSV